MSEPRLVGRIAGHDPGWKWVQLEDGFGLYLAPGDVLVAKPHPEASWRKGTATVLHQDGPRVHVRDVPWWRAIPAIADMDYLFRVESA